MLRIDRVRERIPNGNVLVIGVVNEKMSSDNTFLKYLIRGMFLDSSR